MKIGRNDRCPCGSGKKYKHCCWGKPEPFDPDLEPTPAPMAEPDAPEPWGADVMSPAYWENMAEQLPRNLRKELGPVIGEVKQIAEMESRRERIDAACAVLEEHRDDYERLSGDPAALLERAEKLFGEAPFVSMRFDAADVERAFAAVGYPGSGGVDRKFVATVEKAIGFLLDDARREFMARQLYEALPDYVAAGRYRDGWIIQHSAYMTGKSPGGAAGPFLLSMFMHGLRKWEKRREREQLSLFKEIGLDPEELRRLGPDGVVARMREIQDDPRMAAAAEKFLARHPELHASVQAEARANEEAALALLKRDEARGLLPTAKEIRPWMKVLEKRIMNSALLSQLKPGTEPPDEATARTFQQIIIDLAAEMAGKIFAPPSRLARLKSQLDELRRRFEAAGDPDALAEVQGALMVAQTAMAPEDNYLLTSLCYRCLYEVLEGLYDSAEA